MNQELPKEAKTDAERPVERLVMPTDPDRILAVGPIELHGRRKQEPNDFTELAAAVRKLKREILKPIVPIVEWLARKMNRE